MTPSHWLMRWAPETPGRALDLACGGGRNLSWLAARGWQVCGVDRDTAATASLRAIAEIIDADIENGPWPLAGRQFDLVVVCNYLWRPLFAQIRAAVAPGGLLLWETFADGHQRLGRPSRPEFLLQRGELLREFSDWQIAGFEDIEESGERPRVVQRVAALHPCASGPGAAPLLKSPHSQDIPS